jgi:glycosyltransferase involved in cell wall biosynthesis
MKILLVTEDVPSSKLGGAGKHAILLGNALIDAGHSVELLGYKKRAGDDTNNDFQGKLHTLIDLSNVGLKEASLGLFNPVRKLYIARRIWKAIKQLPYEQFDVIHYHGHTAELGIFVPKNINFVHTLHDQGSECMTMLRFKNSVQCKSTSAYDCADCATKNKPNFFQMLISATAVKFHRYLARKAFTKHKAIFVSDFLQQRFKSVVENSSGINSVAIHNFTDVKAIQKINSTLDYNQSNNKKPIVLLAGRVDQTKGQEEFLDALPDGMFEKVEIHVVGDGHDLERLKQKFSTRGIVFWGFKTLEDVYKLTLQATACVVPSVCEEAFGTTTLEALVMGKFVLALNRGGTPELTRYNSFANQLQLFEDMQSLTHTLSKMDFFAQVYPISFKSDVTARLPEILSVYKNKVHI